MGSLSMHPGPVRDKDFCRTLGIHALKDDGMRLHPPLALLLIAGCSRGETHTPRLATPTIDTLASGAVSVMSPGPTAWSDTNGWRVVEVGRITGEDGAPSEMTRPYAVGVDGEGRVYVSMDGPPAIKVYSADGKYLRTIGRVGEGPGEYRGGTVTVVHDTVILHDSRLARVSLYDTAGNFLTSWRSTCCTGSEARVDREGRFYARGNRGTPDGQTQFLYVQSRLDGSDADTLAVPLGPKPHKFLMKAAGVSSGYFVPESPEMLYTVAPAGGILYGWNGRYEVVESRTGTDTVRVFGRNWTAPAIPEPQRQALLKMMQSWSPALAAQVTLSDMPDVHPAFEGIMTDAHGNVWLAEPAGADTTARHYDVFDSTGVYLGPVRTPRALQPWGTAWVGDEALSTAQDADGMPYVARFRVER